MISSLILLALNYFKVVDPTVSLGFWKWYALGMAVELAIVLICIKKLDNRDQRTNYGRSK